VQDYYRPLHALQRRLSEYGIQPSQLFYWRRGMEEGALTGVDSEERVVPESELKALKDRIKRLKQVLGRKTEENEILKEAVRIARPKSGRKCGNLPKKSTQTSFCNHFHR
jgi:transposase